MPVRSTRRAALASLAAVTVLSFALPNVAAAAPTKLPPQAKAHGAQDTEVQILAINDFHGHLEPGTNNTGGVPSGGAEHLATHIRELEATNPNTVVVSAGDLIGASPLLSALFHDEPTIEAMNAIGLDINAVGNHEFDEGYEELLRMAEGGCHPIDGCQTPKTFEGADFEFLAANVRYAGTDETVFPSYTVESFPGGAKVAFIGMTLEGTPNIVTPAGVAGLEFDDEADTVNRLVVELKRRQINNIVVLVHEGGSGGGGGINGCNNASGPIVDIVQRMDAEVDAVISGHTHQAYNCIIDGIPVTSASSFGRVLTKMDLTIDRRTREITSITANNGIVTRTTPAADITAILDWYRPFYGPLANRPIGQLEPGVTSISRSTNAAGESPLGNLIADSQLVATAPSGFGDAQVAFMNPGGIRADLVALPDGTITYEAAFTVQPFGNSLVTMTLTGAQIERLLEQQFCGTISNRILQISEGFTYTYDGSKRNQPCATADAVAFDSIRLDGQPLVAEQTYRVTVNNFLAGGGDSFPVLTEGTNLLGGALDLDALEAHLLSFESGVPTPPLGRITRIN